MANPQAWARGKALTLANWCAAHGLDSIAHWLYWQRWVGIFSREPLTEGDKARATALAEELQKERER